MSPLHYPLHLHSHCHYRPQRTFTPVHTHRGCGDDYYRRPCARCLLGILISITLNLRLDFPIRLGSGMEYMSRSTNTYEQNRSDIYKPSIGTAINKFLHLLDHGAVDLKNRLTLLCSYYWEIEILVVIFQPFLHLLSIVPSYF